MSAQGDHQLALDRLLQLALCARPSAQPLLFGVHGLLERRALQAGVGVADVAEEAPHVEGESSGPVTSWAAVARAVGISNDTLTRRRKAWGVEAAKPNFDSTDDARGWYRSCEHRGTGLEPRTRAPRAPRHSKPMKQGTRGTTLADLRRR